MNDTHLVVAGRCILSAHAGLALIEAFRTEEQGKRCAEIINSLKAAQIAIEHWAHSQGVKTP